MASISSFLSAVGFCTIDAEPANATTPMRTSDGCSWTNAFAASRAAAMRDGSTSVARIDSDTSIARMMFRCSEGSVMTALGRAIATISAPRASKKTRGGIWRRMRARGPIAVRISARFA
jgi:hypothetical protein